MSRITTMLFAIVAYAVFFATFCYLIVFVGDLSFAPITVDEGPLAPATTAVAIDIGLILLFALQHTVMARQGFKKWWTRVIPWPAERSVYVLMASAALIVLMTLWRPIDTIVWNVTNPIAADLIWVLFWAGWGIVLLSTFLINHFELFGLQQGWFFFRGREAAKPQLRQPFFYKWVAHPLYSGFFLGFWAAPEMTAGHLLLAAGVSVFMLVAIRYEERDLTSLFGDDYRRYRSSVGMLIPRFGRRGV